MICEKCRIREANIKYTEVINGVRTEHNLCAQCAKEMDLGHYSAIFDGEFPLGKLLSGLLGLEEETAPRVDKKSRVICPSCKTTYEDFVKNSRFGCPDCYSVFDLLISDKMKQLQGSESHQGKRPRYHMEEEQTEHLGEPEEMSAKEQMDILDAKLKEAVRKEEYELAARYRDRIKELKEGIEG